MLAFAHVSCVSMLNSLAACSLSMSALPSAFCLPVCLSVCPFSFLAHTLTHKQVIVTYHFFCLLQIMLIYIFLKHFWRCHFILCFFLLQLCLTHTPPHTHAASTCSKCLTIFAAHKSRQQKWARSITRAM